MRHRPSTTRSKRRLLATSGPAHFAHPGRFDTGSPSQAELRTGSRRHAARGATRRSRSDLAECLQRRRRSWCISYGAGETLRAAGLESTWTSQPSRAAIRARSPDGALRACDADGAPPRSARRSSSCSTMSWVTPVACEPADDVGDRCRSREPVHSPVRRRRRPTVDCAPTASSPTIRASSRRDADVQRRRESTARRASALGGRPSYYGIWRRHGLRTNRGRTSEKSAQAERGA